MAFLESIVHRNEIRAKAEFTFYQIKVEYLKEEDTHNVLAPKYLQIRLQRHLRNLKTRETQCLFVHKRCTLELSEFISAPVTIYCDQAHETFQKKKWQLQLVGIFDNKLEIILGTSDFNFGEHFQFAEAQHGTVHLEDPKKEYQCSVKYRLSVRRFNEDEPDFTRRPSRANIQMKIKKSKKHSCVMLVGTTGSGKTSTLNIFTGNDQPTGNSAHSVTDKTSAWRDEIHGAEECPQWIDNPGWADTGGKSDSQLFKNMLIFMQQRKLFNVQAVIWCVLPQPRMDSTLQEQAAFINTFTENEDRGAIWKKVIIVAKGGKNEHDDCLGARMAAKKLYPKAEPKCLAYEFVTPEVLQGTTDELRINNLKMLTNAEIRRKLETTIESLGEDPIQVVFAHQRCQDCGQIGDPRLMDDMCHKEKTLGHIGKLEQRFPKAHVVATFAAGVFGMLGLTAAAATSPGMELALLGVPFVMAPGTTCALHRFLNTERNAPREISQGEGQATTIPHQQGGQQDGMCVKIHDMRWSCCRKNERAAGCTFVCVCGVVWGNGPPCIMIKHPDTNAAKSLHEYEVYKKKHSLVNIDIDYRVTEESKNNFPSISITAPPPE